MPGWRPMAEGDLDAVMDIAALLHPDNPERREVFESRLALAPECCRVLDGGSGPLGYALAHPSRLYKPLPLDTVLGALTDAPQCLYLHDIAVLPQAQGAGATALLLDHLRHIARRDSIGALALVAVNDSVGYWQRHGFAVVDAPDLAAILGSYGGGGCYMVASI